MRTPEKYTNKHLSIEIVESQTGIEVQWEGKSIDREPGKSILYRKSLKWQELNFTALEVFRTDDSRLEIKGL